MIIKKKNFKKTIKCCLQRFEEFWDEVVEPLNNIPSNLISSYFPP
jgi:hypothetical protein